MTREEAIKVLNMVEAHGLADEAKQMAIQALSQEPCRYWLNGKCNGNTEVCEDTFSRGDVISREAVITIAGTHTLTVDETVKALEQLPSVTQKGDVKNV